MGRVANRASGEIRWPKQERCRAGSLWLRPGSPGAERGGDAVHPAGSAASCSMGVGDFQPCVFRAAVVVNPGDGLPTDLFPANVVGSVAGLVGFGGAMGGIAFGQLVGYLLDHGFGYGVVFSLAGIFHVAAFVIILATVPVVQSLSLERKLSYPGA